MAIIKIDLNKKNIKKINKTIHHLENYQKYLNYLTVNKHLFNFIIC